MKTDSVDLQARREVAVGEAFAGGYGREGVYGDGRFGLTRERKRREWRWGLLQVSARKSPCCSQVAEGVS